jgi:hypothetical protein
MLRDEKSSAAMLCDAFGVADSGRIALGRRKHLVRLVCVVEWPVRRTGLLPATRHRPSSRGKGNNGYGNDPHDAQDQRSPFQGGALHSSPWIFRPVVGPETRRLVTGRGKPHLGRYTLLGRASERSGRSRLTGSELQPFWLEGFSAAQDPGALLSDRDLHRAFRPIEGVQGIRK